MNEQLDEALFSLTMPPDEILFQEPLLTDDLLDSSLFAEPVDPSLGRSEHYEQEEPDSGTPSPERELASEEDSFGDEEQVSVGSEQFSWKINHAKGDFKLNGMENKTLHGGS